jgi:MYXO-CTERM domain-containing protein
MNRVAGSNGSADLRGLYTFANGGGNIWTAATVGGVIPAGTYAATGAGSSTALDMNAAFAGLSSAGTWSLFLSDNAGADLGFVASASVTITTVPTPAAAGLLGLGGLVAARRRRA